MELRTVRWTEARAVLVLLRASSEVVLLELLRLRHSTIAPGTGRSVAKEEKQSPLNYCLAASC